MKLCLGNKSNTRSGLQSCLSHVALEMSFSLLGSLPFYQKVGTKDLSALRILPSPGVNAAAIGERSGSSFSWVFPQPCDPGGLLPGPRLRIYLPSLLKVDHAQKSAVLEGQHETKKHYKKTLISPPPIHTLTHVHIQTHTLNP